MVFCHERVDSLSVFHFFLYLHLPVAVYCFPHSHRPRDLLVTTQKPLGKKCRFRNSCESLLEVVGYCMQLIAQLSFIQAQKSISDPVINAVTS